MRKELWGNYHIYFLGCFYPFSCPLMASW
jgi:hypothetical protein